MPARPATPGKFDIITGDEQAWLLIRSVKFFTASRNPNFPYYLQTRERGLDCERDWYSTLLCASKTIDRYFHEIFDFLLSARPSHS